MVVCPDCGKNVEADFGMTTCVSCGAVFMVEYDGTIRPPSDEVHEAEERVSEGAGQDLESSVRDSQEETEEEIAEPSQSEAAQESWATEDSVNEDHEQEEYSENFLDQLSEIEPTKEQEESDDPLGIVSFDQSPASTLVDGPYYYDVFISGLDSMQMKQEVLQALSDKRFNFTDDQLKKSIRGGQLKIENINPVKAVLVVLKLQNYDVEVEWQQKLYTDPSAQKDMEE